MGREGVSLLARVIIDNGYPFQQQGGIPAFAQVKRHKKKRQEK
jgi:hypothetical protein